MSDYKNPRPLSSASASDPCVVYDNSVSFDKLINENEVVTTYKGVELQSVPSLLEQIEAEANAAVILLGWHQVGLFADGFTYLLQNDIAKDAAGDWYRWNGALPKVVTAGTLPSSDANFVKIDYKSHTELTDRNPADGSAHNADDISTISEDSVQSALDNRPRYSDVFDQIDWESNVSSDRTMFNLSNFQGQDGVNASQIPVVIHDYTDAIRTVQIDKVGGDIETGDYIFALRRASNNIRTPTKAGDYVSNAGFMRCTYDVFNTTSEFTASISGSTLTVSAVSTGTITLGSLIQGSGILEGTTIAAILTGSGGVGTYSIIVRGAVTVQEIASTACTAKVKEQILGYYIGPKGDMGWAIDYAKFTSNYSGVSHTYQFNAAANKIALAAFQTPEGVKLSIQNSVGAGVRTDIIAPINQTSGMSIQALGGGIDLIPKSGSNITARGNIITPSGQDLVLTATNSAMSLGATNGVFTNSPFKLSPYSVATLPSAATFAGYAVYVSNGDAGQPCLAVSVGGVWKRIALGAAVSAT